MPVARFRAAAPRAWWRSSPPSARRKRRKTSQGGAERQQGALAAPNDEMKFQSAGTFIHSSRRWNILAATENYIGALELPTGQCVPRPEPRCDSWEDRHERYVFDTTLQTTNHHLDPRQVEKVRQAPWENIRALWPTGAEA